MVTVDYRRSPINVNELKEKYGKDILITSLPH